MVLSRPTRRRRSAGAREIGGRDESYRLLAIEILALAHDDYTKDKTHAQHDALHFIMSEWCEDICDGVGIDVDAYRAECKKKWESERLKIVERKPQNKEE